MPRVLAHQARRLGCSSPMAASSTSSCHPADTLDRKNVIPERAVFWSSVLFRLGYALWIPLALALRRTGTDLGAYHSRTSSWHIPLTPLVSVQRSFAEAVRKDSAHMWQAHATSPLPSLMYLHRLSRLNPKEPAFRNGLSGHLLRLGLLARSDDSYHIYHVRPLDETFPLPASPQLVVNTPNRFFPRHFKSTLRP